MKKLLISFLSILFLLTFSNLLIAQNLPTDEQIETIYQQNPKLIYEMIRKLYVLERSVPKVVLPPISFFVEKKTGDLHLDWKDTGSMYIGTPDYNLEYAFKMNPNVLYGFRQETRTPPLIYISLGMGAVGLGVILGLLLSK